MQALTASLLSLLFMVSAGPGWLGVYLALDSKEAVVTEVIAGTPAEKAGLRGGDVMVAVGKTKTPTRDEFIRAIQGHEPGERVKIKVRRNKRERVVVVRLGERPENPGAGTPDTAKDRKPAKPAKPAPPAERSAPAVESVPAAGAEVEAAAKPAGKGYMGISVREADRGLAIDRVLKNGPSAKSGLENGDVIRSINGKRVGSLDDLDGALKTVRAGQRVELGILRGGRQKAIEVTAGSRSGEASPVRVRASAREPVRAVEVVEAPAAELEAVDVPASDPPKPRRARVIRTQPAQPAQPAQRGGQVRSARSARSARPARPAKPARPARAARAARRAQQARPAQPARPARRARSTDRAPEYNLQRELRELRAELKELRRLLEQMRRERRGGGGNQRKQ